LFGPFLYYYCKGTHFIIFADSSPQSSFAQITQSFKHDLKNLLCKNCFLLEMRHLISVQNLEFRIELRKNINRQHFVSQSGDHLVLDKMQKRHTKIQMQGIYIETHLNLIQGHCVNL